MKKHTPPGLPPIYVPRVFASVGQPEVDIVSQADAEAGTSTTAYRWTPERVKQAIDALGGVGGGGLTHPQILARGLGA